MAAAFSRTTGRLTARCKGPLHSALDAIVQVSIDIVQLPFEPANVLGDAAADGEQCVLETVALGDQHFEHLATTGQQSVKSIGRLIGQRPGVGTHALRKERQGIGIDPIGFGELAGGPGEVTDLARVGHDQREPGRREGGDGGALVSASGLHHDERRGVPAQALEQCLDASLIIGHGPAVT